MSARARLRRLIGLSKGIARGDVFPAAGRAPIAEAPGGSWAEGAPPWGNQAEAFRLVHHRLPMPGLARPLRLLHITDVHVRGLGPWLDQLCAFLRAAPPADLVLLTGDLVTHGWSAEAWARFAAACPRGVEGTFAIRGNWEHWCGAGGAAWAERLAEQGIHLLHNAAVERAGLRIIGLDDALAGTADWSLVEGAPVGPPTVVLSHCPDTFPRIAATGLPLVLSGHSHGGQVRLPALGALWLPKGTGRWVSGWYREGHSHMHVSPGLGWSIAPLRARCPPQIDLITLLPG